MRAVPVVYGFRDVRVPPAKEPVLIAVAAVRRGRRVSGHRNRAVRVMLRPVRRRAASVPVVIGHSRFVQLPVRRQRQRIVMVAELRVKVYQQVAVFVPVAKSAGNAVVRIPQRAVLTVPTVQRIAFPRGGVHVLHVHRGGFVRGVFPEVPPLRLLHVGGGFAVIVRVFAPPLIVVFVIRAQIQPHIDGVRHHDGIGAEGFGWHGLADKGQFRRRDGIGIAVLVIAPALAIVIVACPTAESFNFIGRQSVFAVRLDFPVLLARIVLDQFGFVLRLVLVQRRAVIQRFRLPDRLSLGVAVKDQIVLIPGVVNVQIAVGVFQGHALSGGGGRFPACGDNVAVTVAGNPETFGVALRRGGNLVGRAGNRFRLKALGRFRVRP